MFSPAHGGAADSDALRLGGIDYRLVRKLGVGGMGEVFLAQRRDANGFARNVALKFISPGLLANSRAASFCRSFVEEAALTATLQHPNIGQIYDLQHHEKLGPVQVLEYIGGHTLKDLIVAAKGSGRRLSTSLVCFIASELANALAYAHSATSIDGTPLNIVHRDVTPHNIMVSEHGVVKLIDFGIALTSVEDRESTSSHTAKGKDQYHAPEQLLGGRVDGRADQFALALSLFEGLELERFFKMEPTDTDTRVHLKIAQLSVNGVLDSMAASTIDESLAAILSKALSPQAEHRFSNAGEFGRAVCSYASQQGWVYSALDAQREVDQLMARPAICAPI